MVKKQIALRKVPGIRFGDFQVQDRFFFFFFSPVIAAAGASILMTSFFSVARRVGRRSHTEISLSLYPFFFFFCRRTVSRADHGDAGTYGLTFLFNSDLLSCAEPSDLLFSSPPLFFLFFFFPSTRKFLT